MKEWNFTFTAIRGGASDEYSSSVVIAKSAINKANKWVKKNFPDYELSKNVRSVNCNHDTYMMLLRAFD